MFELLTVIRKRAEIPVDRFRYFMEHEYGPTYAAMKQVRTYEQFFLSDVMKDGAEPAIDAIVRIAFDSQEDMAVALDSDAYRNAHKMREMYMQPTSIGIHSAVIDRTVKLVGGS